jgi:hypothetical protein
MRNNLNYIKAILLFLAITTGINCSNDNEISPLQEDINSDAQTLVFNSFEAYQNQINNLKLLDQENLEQWISQNNSKSLYSHIEKNESYFEEISEIEEGYVRKLPNNYKAVFNENYEIIIENKIIWLNIKNGNLYTFSKTDDIISLKNNIENATPSGSIKITSIKSNLDNNKVDLASGDTDSRHTYYMNNGTNYRDNCGSGSTQFKSPRFRYLHDVYHLQTTYDRYTATSELYLNIRLQYRSSRWRGAGEKRNISVNIGHNIKLFNNGYPIPLNSSNSTSVTYNCSGDVFIPLKFTPTSYDIGFSGNNAKFEITAWGTISHELTGGYSHWDNNFVW